MLTFGSLFSGIGGFDRAFTSAGMSCAWQSEIDGRCSELLAARFPDTPNLGDVRNVTRHTARPVDLVCGGFPCQDLSVAGKRAGLAGERSGLWFEFYRVLSELGPRWAVIENVPGLLSSNGGRDFAIILRGLGDLGYRTAWRVLDAQYFGVAQRRRRVFLIASLGSGRAAQVLFESEGVPGNPAPSREAGAGVTAVAGTLAANRGGLDRPAGNANEPDFCVVNCFNGYTGGADDNDAQAQHIIAELGGDLAGGVASETGHGWWSERLPTLRCENTTSKPQTMVAQPLRAGGQFSDMGDGQSNVIAFAWKQGDESGHHKNGRGRSYIVRKGEYAGSLSETRQDAVAYAEVAWSENKGGQLTPSETAKALRAGASHSYQGIGVRRLTPTECERLQGFPDGWTLGFPDSVRYKMLGNAVAVPNVEWIGTRIVEIELTSPHRASQLPCEDGRGAEV